VFSGVAGIAHVGLSIFRHGLSRRGKIGGGLSGIIGTTIKNVVINQYLMFFV
jgi:hypothetical protein